MSIHPLDRSRLPALRRLLLDKAMPPNSLGRLSELALHLAMIKEVPFSSLSLLLFAGDHGVIKEGVTHSPQEITYQQCLNFARGGGACSLFASLNGATLSVIDVGVNHQFSPFDGVLDEKVGFGTRNFLEGTAMDLSACRKAMEAGRRSVGKAVEDGCDVVAFGEMGVGNTTSASAVAAALTGQPVRCLTGKGSGLSDAELKHKVEVIERGLALHPSRDAVSVLCNLGGYEIAAIAGAMLEASERSLPILLDGFVVTSAALAAFHLDHAITDYLIPCHRSGMQGHQAILDAIGLDAPLLDLSMQLGEGTGALAAWPLVRLASRLLFQMTSFCDANVTDSTHLLSELGLV
ncbi:MAG: nicotinate-nucleotide--dimethylbenzimidazole phosphoribosyltransferase [Sphaerochaeta sp.]|uniref:nicotinate-nucleotide--dimethylbenzimidazole phosphoribosyltransferase n=1 Tax=Sphaerochaeta sp. TaxID=1972642 RepID=UPI002FC72226